MTTTPVYYPLAYIMHVDDKAHHEETFCRLRDVPGEVSFLSDLGGGDTFWHRICGMRFRGIIFSGNARLSAKALQYLLSRMYHEDPRGFTFVVDNYHREILVDILTEWYHSGSDVGDEGLRDWCHLLNIDIDEIIL